MTKMDLKKKYKHLYNPSAKEVSITDVPEIKFLMIDGCGDPNTVAEFATAVEALYSLSYAIKFAVKKNDAALDYVVAPLEGLWWIDNMQDFSIENKGIWKWTVMIAQPDFITEELFNSAVEQVVAKKGIKAASDVRFEAYQEGLVAQVMYFGPYADEGPTIEKMHNYIKENDYELIGKHHEIYLSDQRKVSPEKLKTVIRQPIKRKN